jgi:ADP-ribose pyrophosphatase YjhB (NUDIX family)
MSFPFNVRVYGALIIDRQILLSDEVIEGWSFTKLPGGGLQYGEGPEDCVIREYMEETGIEVKVASHVYTTGFFQKSAFNSAHQVISIYYQVEPVQALDTSEIRPLERGQKFRWIKLEELSPENFTFPIDQFIVPRLRLLM